MTLIEIMVVIAIIGVMTGLVALAVIPAIHRARVDRVYADFQTIETALEAYAARTGSELQPSAGLGVLVERDYLKKAPEDPWGSPYAYALVGGKPVLTSYGADQVAGGTDKDQDLVSTQPKPQ